MVSKLDMSGLSVGGEVRSPAQNASSRLLGVKTTD